MVKLRKASSYSQEKVSLALGLSNVEYDRYERGEEEVPYNVLERIADFYGCDLIRLFEEADNDVSISFPINLGRMTQEDIVEVIHFHDIVKSYLKMVEIEKL